MVLLPVGPNRRFLRADLLERRRDVSRRRWNSPARLLETEDDFTEREERKWSQRRKKGIEASRTHRIKAPLPRGNLTTEGSMSVLDRYSDELRGRGE